jgi:hypothetical protein
VVGYTPRVGNKAVRHLFFNTATRWYGGTPAMSAELSRDQRSGSPAETLAGVVFPSSPNPVGVPEGDLEIVTFEMSIQEQLLICTANSATKVAP